MARTVKRLPSSDCTYPLRGAPGLSPAFPCSVSLTRSRAGLPLVLRCFRLYPVCPGWVALPSRCRWRRRTRPGNRGRKHGPDLGLLASRAVRQCISFVLSDDVCHHLLQQPQDTGQMVPWSYFLFCQSLWLLSYLGGSLLFRFISFCFNSFIKVHVSLRECVSPNGGAQEAPSGVTPPLLLDGPRQP